MNLAVALQATVNPNKIPSRSDGWNSGVANPTREPSGLPWPEGHG